MKKAFYPASRAHHAVCMMIDFGMKFVKRNGDFWTVDGLMHLHGSNYEIELSDESVHLLEPVFGDGVFDGIIVYRHKKPFHWPEFRS